MAAEVEVLFHLHESSSLSGNLLVLSFQLRRRWAPLSQAVSCTQDSGNRGSRGTVLCIQGQVSPAEVGRSPQSKVGKGWRGQICSAISPVGALGAGSVTKVSSHLCVQEI